MAPEAKNYMGEVAAISEVWADLVENWDSLEKCFLDEVGLNWSKGGHLRAKKTLKMMNDLGC